MLKFRGPLFAAAIFLANYSFAEGGYVEEVTIIGDRGDAQQLPGSAFVVDERALAKFEYTDINRMVAVPVRVNHATTKECQCSFYSRYSY